MRKKTCTWCGRSKPISEFGIKRASKDGLLSHCRACVSIREADRIDAPNRGRAKREKYKKYLAEHPEVVERRKKKAAERATQTREKRRKQRYAHGVVARRIRDGTLVPPVVCERCSGCISELHAHHEDYSHPLDVVWLCPTCHGLRHREINNERRSRNARTRTHPTR